MDSAVNDVKIFMSAIESIQPKGFDTFMLYYFLSTREEIEEFKEAVNRFVGLKEAYHKEYKEISPRCAALKLACPEDPEDAYAILLLSRSATQQNLYNIAKAYLAAKAEILDAIFDVIWELIVCAIELDLPLVEGWMTGAASNFAKIQKDSRGNLKTRADGKLLKPDGWQPPGFVALINNQAIDNFQQKKLMREHSLKNKLPD